MMLSTRIRHMGTFHPGVPVPPFHAAHRYIGRRREMVCSFRIDYESPFESTMLKRAPESGDRTMVSTAGDPRSLPFALGGTDDDDDPPKYWMFDSFMGLNRDTFVEILKIDVNGGEFDVPTAFLSARAAEGNARPVGQLQLEIHAREGRENFEYFARWWAASLRPFWTEPNLVYITNIVPSVRPELSEYPFINIRGNHALGKEALN
ncbi:hypothetical protein EDB89DRAFT_2141491 [Lactarius sanguifluus]|nr:hypothetical protein EDB89DRAFT_2141491 [Lactarius sanguifluus]